MGKVLHKNSENLSGVHIVNANADPKFGGSEKRTDRLKQFALLDMPTYEGWKYF